LPSNKIKLCFICAILFLANRSSAGIYTIGNSLTVDALYNYQGEYQYSIQCNQNLQTIFENPAGTCPGDVNPRGRPWDIALNQNSYDFVTVQPFYFTTFQQDFNAISTWMRMQPNAKFIIHTGWPGLNVPSVYNAPFVPNSTFVHSAAYFNNLINDLEAAFPGRQVGSTNVIGILNSIQQDIAAGTSPYTGLEPFYRDPVHFDGLGQYIATNSFYHAMGRPIDERGFDYIPLQNRAYLNAKILQNVSSVPEPTSPYLQFVCGVAVPLEARQRLRRCYDSCWVCNPSDISDLNW